MSKWSEKKRMWLLRGFFKNAKFGCHWEGENGDLSKIKPSKITEELGWPLRRDN